MISRKNLEDAFKAYKRGEMPISRWSKKVFLAVIQKELGYVPDTVKAMPKVRIYEYLIKAGVYPTGNCRKYRYTVFYRVNLSRIIGCGF